MQVTAALFGPHLGDDAFFRLEVVQHLCRFESRLALREDRTPRGLAQRIDGAVGSACAGLKVEFKVVGGEGDVVVFGLGLAEVIDLHLVHVAVDRVCGRADDLGLDGRIGAFRLDAAARGFQAVGGYCILLYLNDGIHLRRRNQWRFSNGIQNHRQCVRLCLINRIRESQLCRRHRIHDERNRIYDALGDKGCAVNTCWLDVVLICFNMSGLLATIKCHD